MRRGNDMRIAPAVSAPEPAQAQGWGGDWNPARYLAYGRERARPAMDLVARIDRAEPRRILDLGCGPGNSAAILAARWPGAKIIGLDNSKAMIEAARRDFPEGEWILGDALTAPLEGPFDIVFSNAAFQWIPRHPALIARLAGLLAPEGILAVQAPRRGDMAVRKAIDEVGSRERWRGLVEGAELALNYRELDSYYDILIGHFDEIELWQTSYFHVLEGAASVIDFVRTTALRPWLDRLPDEKARGDFEREVLEACSPSYPARPDGKILFPFARLFFVATSPRPASRPA
ncbi:MAG TPA: methyltransferase domain-containing protein [Rectinemataceae bacterium]|nr:methyltransferase domain-containing protein [Rectinemataceae bacterium]